MSGDLVGDDYHFIRVQGLEGALRGSSKRQLKGSQKELGGQEGLLRKLGRLSGIGRLERAAGRALKAAGQKGQHFYDQQ